MQIKRLFDPSRDIYRTIEKVITYGSAQEARLKAEITEYIVTERIEEQFERLLSRMQAAMDAGGNEIGVWVSGFYGSGKSSFTKYLGLALDDRVQVDGIRFQKHLQDRLHRPQTRALLATIANRYPAAVVLLDLASEMLAGATMEDVSTVLYYKVLQWAGYSRNLKVAALERRLRKDGRYAELEARIRQELGVSWTQVQNDPLVIDSLLPEIAHDLYPQLFRSATAFTTETTDFVRFENERVKEMIDIAREATGRQYILFIVDEVGQYVGARPNLILNLDGLAKNLKDVGGGRVWIIGTAQQTLTEDDPRSALNSPELYKLKDRFPIQIDLESSDIKEICYRRLLGKSLEGERTLDALFDKHGQALRHNTRLQDARYYDGDFDRTTFTHLYPFLPAHFDVLLHLLGALARTTGGIGLRSAIKVIQDILVEGSSDHPPVADRPVGWLATTVTLYDALEKDIRRAFPSLHKAVGRVSIRFPDSPLHQEVARTVAVLQILGNMPVTPQNVTSLMHPAIDASSRRDAVDAAIRDLVLDTQVPFVEKDGALCFVSEKLGDIDQERAQIPLRAMETRRIQNEALREAFNPLPATQLHGSLTVTAGLKAAVGGQVSSLAGERETLQQVVELVEPAGYEAARTRLIEESRQRTSHCTLFLLGRANPEIDDKTAEIFRCREVVQRHRNDPDQEVRDYCASQADRANRLNTELEHLIKRGLSQGSFIFRGQTTAVDSLDHSLLEAARKHLSMVAAQVFDRYAEAPVRAETTLAEKFLRAGTLKAVTSAIDPLGLVQISGGTPRVRTDHKALVSIRDYVERNGSVEGKRLIDHFTDAPFGWSPDTLRYLVAAMLVSGEIKLKVSGREVTVNGQQAVDALRTNNAFKAVGVALREGRPSNALLARAAARLTELCGDTIVPLEDDISKAATRHFPQCQLRFGPLAEKLEALGLPGAEKVRALNQALADILLTDASDAPERLGGEESPLYEGLKWAGQVEVALKNGLEATLRALQQHRREIEALPESGVPGQLRADVAEELNLIGQRLRQDSFHQHAADLNSRLTTLRTRTRDAALRMADTQRDTLHDAIQDLRRLPEWLELTQQEQQGMVAGLEGLVLEVSADLSGLKRLISQEFVIRSRAAELRRKIEALGRERRLERDLGTDPNPGADPTSNRGADPTPNPLPVAGRGLSEDSSPLPATGRGAGGRGSAEAGGRGSGEAGGAPRLTRHLALPRTITRPAELDALIRRLEALRLEAADYAALELTLRVEE